MQVRTRKTGGFSYFIIHFRSYTNPPKPSARVRVMPGYGNADPYPYPPLPAAKTRTGWRTLGEH